MDFFSSSALLAICIPRMIFFTFPDEPLFFFCMFFLYMSFSFFWYLLFRGVFICVFASRIRVRTSKRRY